MAEQNMISEKQVKIAQSEPVILIEKPEMSYGYFIDMVLSEAESILNVDSETHCFPVLPYLFHARSGFTRKLKLLFEDARNFPKNASDSELCRAAMCVLDNRSNEIRAIIGGRH